MSQLPHHHGENSYHIIFTGKGPLTDNQMQCRAMLPSGASKIRITLMGYTGLKEHGRWHLIAVSDPLGKSWDNGLGFIQDSGRIILENGALQQFILASCLNGHQSIDCIPPPDCETAKLMLRRVGSDEEELEKDAEYAIYFKVTW